MTSNSPVSTRCDRQPSRAATASISAALRTEPTSTWVAAGATASGRC
jgi:hypothetical protein